MPATIRTRADRTAEEEAGRTTTTDTKPPPSSSINIQPLRDLARNFDIDIEPYLQEYLQQTTDLNDNDNDYDNGDVKSNFSKAALKIQNSAAIYNRKVDFLHQVVYEVFHDFIQTQLHSSSKKKRKSSNSSGGGDVDIETFHEYDPEMQFLLLDDVLPMDRTEGNRKINLRESVANQNGGDLTMMNNLDNTMATNNNVLGMDNNHRTPTNNDVTLLSLGGVMSATRMMDQNGTFMITRQSLGQSSPTALSRMLMANLQGGPNGGGAVGDGNLRLLAGMCDVGSDGALLMPGTRTSVFINGEAAVMGGGVAAGDGGENNEDNGTIEIFPGGLSPPGPGDVDRNNSFGMADTDVDNNDDGASFGNNNMDDFGDDNENGVGFELNHDYAPEEGVNEEDIDTPKVLNFDQTKQQLQPPKKKKIVEDPWAVLDPHEPSKDKAQPLRIGVTYRLPPGLDDEDRPSVSVTGSRTRAKKTTAKKKSARNNARHNSNDDFHQPPFLADVTFDEGDENAEVGDLSFQVETGVHVNLLKSNELIFGDEFAYVAKAHAKHKDAVKRKRRLQQQQQQQQQDDGLAADPYRDNYHNDYDDENDDYGGGGGGGFDFDDGDDGSFGAGDNETRQAANRSNVDFTAIDDVFAASSSSGLNENAYNDDDEFGGDSSQQTFEELCRAHLRKYAKSAEMYAKETQLTKRVGAWQTGLAPLLEEQEERPAFDIHDVGREVLDTIESTLTTVRKRTSTGEKKVDKSSSQNNRVGFSAIFAKDCEDYEVCRVFLSTLMLCNCGNITIHNGGDGERLAKDVQVELLDAMFQPPMETYLAPSERIEEVTDDKEN